MYYDKAFAEKNVYKCLYIKDNWLRNDCKKTIQDFVKKEKEIKKNQKNLPACAVLDNINIDCKTKNCKVKKLFASFELTPSLKKKKEICEKIKEIEPKKY